MARRPKRALRRSAPRIVPMPSTSPTRKRSTPRPTRFTAHSAASTSWSTMPAFSGRWRRSGSRSRPAFRRVIDVNLTGMYLVCRAIVPRMRKQAGPSRGKIVNVSSIQGKEGLAQSGRLRDFQGRRDRAHQGAGQGSGGRRHHGQLRDAGGGRNRHGEGDHARAPRRHRRAHSDGTFCRGARRSRPWSRFSHPTTAHSRPAPCSTCPAAGPLTRKTRSWHWPAKARSSSGTTSRPKGAISSMTGICTNTFPSASACRAFAAAAATSRPRRKRSLNS